MTLKELFDLYGIVRVKIEKKIPDIPFGVVELQFIMDQMVEVFKKMNAIQAKEIYYRLEKSWNPDYLIKKNDENPINYNETILKILHEKFYEKIQEIEGKVIGKFVKNFISSVWIF